MWIGRSHCLVKYDRIRLMSWSWQSHLWMQTEKSTETLGMQTECIRCIACQSLSKSVKLHAIFFFACYGLICHGSEWLARVGQGSKADVWLECIHKGNGLASLATLNAAHSGKDPGTMMKYRAQAIHMIYPHIEDLYCILLKLDWRKFGDMESLICLMRACACTSCWNMLWCATQFAWSFAASHSHSSASQQARSCVLGFWLQQGQRVAEVFVSFSHWCKLRIRMN